MRIGIDLGGTKTEFIALSSSGDVLLRERQPTPVGDYRRTLDTIRAGVLSIENRLGKVGSVGIGIPGTLSPATALVKGANSNCLNGTRLDVDLKDLLQREVRIANDANCFALSEAIDGAASRFGVVFGVILGTGTGGGLVIERKIRTGPNAIAGEWGHNSLPWHRNAVRDGAPDQPATLLVRQGGLYRNVAVGTGPCPQLSHADRTHRQRQGDRATRRGR